MKLNIVYVMTYDMSWHISPWHSYIYSYIAIAIYGMKNFKYRCMPAYLVSRNWFCPWYGVCVCVCVYPPLTLIIISGMMWSNVTPYDWFKKFYSFYMAVVVTTISRCGHRINQYEQANVVYAVNSLWQLFKTAVHS